MMRLCYMIDGFKINKGYKIYVHIIHNFHPYMVFLYWKVGATNMKDISNEKGAAVLFRDMEFEGLYYITF